MMRSIDDIRQIRAQAQQDLAASLARISGGADLVEWFDGAPEFGDAEIVSLLLDRRGPSTLRIALDHCGKSAVFVFELTAWIDVEMRGFSHQNVIGSLTLRRAEERDVQPWELGVGCDPGEWTIELGPCFGAYGTLRATIARIAIEPGPDA